MRAALYFGRQDLRLMEVAEPVPGPGEVKLRVHYNGICGSDLLEYYDGPVTTRSTPHPLTGVQNPVIMGHELCGEVVDLGAGVDDLEIGTLVAVEPAESCGRCLYCGLGQYNHCPLLAIQGYNRGGGLAEFTVVQRRLAHALPAALSALQGALIEPLAIAWHTANRCEVEAGQVVAIHGAGPIGAGVFLTLKRRGVEAIVVDPAPSRRAALAKLGARTVLDPAAGDVVAAIRDLTGGRGAHASIDAAGGASAFAAMLHGTRIDGTAVVVAIHHEPVVIPPFDLLMPEVRLTGVALSVNAFPSVIAEMARGSYPLEGWVETIPFDGLIDQGIGRLRRQQGMKIVVDVLGGSRA
ncbi:MAG TPA: alcohol dehydrogenase catalytic domain-containing protein [Steroidobacteraceae bacterium]|nr:alcohol dehydrogenase catalytic domain-containing protein [Steroidobacteraceae bacterium]